MSEQDRAPLPDNFLQTLNDSRGGFNETLGLSFVSVSYDEIVGEIAVGPHLAQPYGLVHGGVYAAMVETLASVGAAIHAMAIGKHAVGLENSTSFLRATRGGTLRGVARPLVRGRKSHVWEVTITDASEKAVASGRVRMLLLDADTRLAGEEVSLGSRERG